MVPRREAAFRRHSRQFGKVDMRAEIGLAGVCQRIVIAMRAYRLERIAVSVALIAIVDDQRGDRMLPSAAAEIPEQRQRRQAAFEDVAGFLRTQPLPRRRLNRATHCKDGAAIAAKLHDALAPAILAIDELRDGQRVEKLIGDKDQRPVRQVFQAFKPVRRIDG
jgi:hypothetical protein